MKALFVIWRGEDLDCVEVLQDVGGCDLNATARRLLRCCSGDVCRIYLCVKEKLIFAGEEEKRPRI